MTLTLIDPIEITPDFVTSTNLTNADADWSSGTSYAIGDRMTYQNGVWEALTANTNAPPLKYTNDANWTFLGASNKTAAFDLQSGASRPSISGTVSENATSITYTIESIGAWTAIAFDGLEATSISVVVTNTATSAVIWDYSYSLEYERDTTSPWHFIYMTPDVETSHVVTGLNIPGDMQIEITISHPSNTAKVASIILGVDREYGKVTEATTSIVSLTQFSQAIDRVTLIPRPNALKHSVKLFIKNPDRRHIDAFNRYNGKGVYFIASGRDYLRAYGRVETFQTVSRAHGWDTCTVEFITL